MSDIKTIGVLTSGGDAPGMNGVIRSVTRTGNFYGMKVMGIRRGYQGLSRGDIIDLSNRSVSDTLQRGGTFLMTARSESFKTAEGVERAANMCKVFGFDALVTIGGDGTYRGALDLSRSGIPVITIPGTIDNDIACTEYTIGFDTALNTAIEAVDKLRDTASSHERCSVIQVMGRHAGYLAVNTGIAAGAEVVLIPEQELDFDKDVVRKILNARNRGKQHYIVIVAEGAGQAIEVAERIEAETGIESRATVLGYVQRGGKPNFRDRYLASMMGLHAVECLAEGRLNRAVILKDGQVTDMDLEEALSMQKSISEKVLENAAILSR